MPDIHLPYEFIAELPKEAQRQIWRDFRFLIDHLPAGLSVFDAIIDSDITTSSPGDHRYKNLTDLLANESWSDTFNVGVNQRSTAIVEPAGMSLAGKGDLALFGLGAVPGIQTTHHKGWTWQALAVPTGQSVIYTGIAFTPTSSMTIQSGGVCTMRDSYCGANVTGLNANISGSSAFAFNTAFDGALSMSSSGGIQVPHHFYDCTAISGVTVGNLIDFVWLGGSILGSTLTITGSAIASVSADLGNVVIGTNTNDVVVQKTGTNTGGTLSVTATAGNVTVRGTFQSVTFSGTSTGTRTFQGESAGNFDFTGPGHVEAAVRGSGGAARATLRGSGITAYLAFAGLVINTAVSMVGVVDATIIANIADPGAGAKAYSIDAASNRVLFILGGSHAPGFTVAPTNSGTNIRIITEKDDSLVSTPPVFNPTLLMGELAAIQSGVIQIPAPTGAGGAPSGPAGGSLGGTYPSPIFSGRDTSFDKMDMDLLLTNLGVVTSGMEVQPLPKTLPDFSQLFMLMGG